MIINERYALTQERPRVDVFKALAELQEEVMTKETRRAARPQWKKSAERAALWLQEKINCAFDRVYKLLN